MFTRVLVPLMLLVAACSGDKDDDEDGGVTEDDFAELYLDAYCDAGCTADLSAVCDEANRTTNTGGGVCDFDAEAAADCVDYGNWSCEPLISGSSDTYPLPPASCTTVCG